MLRLARARDEMAREQEYGRFLTASSQGAPLSVGDGITSQQAAPQSLLMPYDVRK